MLKKVRDQIYTIRKDILSEKLNKGRKIAFLKDYFRWILFYKYSQKKWIIKFENGFSSIVYPYPDHDAGEQNIWTRNVDYYDIEFIRKIIPEGSYIIDAGCNVGNRTLALADKLSGALLIDAGQQAVERTKENLQLNHLPPHQFIVLHKAIGKEKGVVRFSNKGGASTQNKVIEEGDQEGNISIDMDTLDNIIREWGKQPAFIKLDLEGQDLNALCGCTETLKTPGLKLIKFERDKHIPLQSFKNVLSSNGWIVFALNDEGKPTINEKVLETNFNLFTCKEVDFEKFTTT